MGRRENRTGYGERLEVQEHSLRRVKFEMTDVQVKVLSRKLDMSLEIIEVVWTRDIIVGAANIWVVFKAIG